MTNEKLLNKINKMSGRELSEFCAKHSLKIRIKRTKVFSLNSQSKRFAQ